MKPVSEPASHAAETLSDADLAAVHGGSLLSDLLRRQPGLFRPVLPPIVLRPVLPIRRPNPPDPGPLLPVSRPILIF